MSFLLHFLGSLVFDLMIVLSLKITANQFVTMFFYFCNP